MSGVSGTDGVPSVDRSMLPADIKRASAEDQKTYRTALGFEQTLVSEMLKNVNVTGKSGQDGMTASSDEDEGGSGAPAAASRPMYSSGTW